MDEEAAIKKIDISEFMKPKCPVSIGDRFYKKYHVPSSLVFNIVEAIEEKEDDAGTYYVITARRENVAIGIKVLKYSSRNFDDTWVIEKKGNDF